MRRAVAHVYVDDGRVTGAGTGFLISPRLFLTNQHVVADAAAATGLDLSMFRPFDTIEWQTAPVVGREARVRLRVRGFEDIRIDAPIRREE